MTRVVTLLDFIPGERRDGRPWTGARMEEGADRDGAFTEIEAYVFGADGQPAADADPVHPQARSFTSTNAQLLSGWYRIVFTDAADHEEPVGPIFVPSATQAYTSVLAVRRVLSPDGSQDPTLGTAASLSDTELEEAIEEAAAEINSRVAARYTLPFNEIPPLIEKLNRDIAAYLATLTYRRSDPIDPNDPVQKRYDRAQAMLARIESGKTELTTEEAGSPAPESDAAAAINLYEGELFTPASFAIGSSGSVRWAPADEES